jgi:hypothetical protein
MCIGKESAMTMMMMMMITIVIPSHHPSMEEGSRCHDVDHAVAVVEHVCRDYVHPTAITTVLNSLFANTDGLY